MSSVAMTLCVVYQLVFVVVVYYFFIGSFRKLLNTPPYIQSTPSNSISLRSIPILSSHLRLGLPSALLPTDFPSRVLYVRLISCVLHVSPISSPLI